jgi:hypothetical protein
MAATTRTDRFLQLKLKHAWRYLAVHLKQQEEDLQALVWANFTNQKVWSSAHGLQFMDEFCWRSSSRSSRFSCCWLWTLCCRPTTSGYHHVFGFKSKKIAAALETVFHALGHEHQHHHASAWQFAAWFEFEGLPEVERLRWHHWWDAVAILCGSLYQATVLVSSSDLMYKDYDHINLEGTPSWRVPRDRDFVQGHEMILFFICFFIYDLLVLSL